jgi:mycothiol system anti-sigma-R factor
MNCDEAHDRLYIYLDGEVTFLRRGRIRRHLRLCPPCEDGFVFEERLKLRVREGCREEIPIDVTARLREYLLGHTEDGM